MTAAAAYARISPSDTQVPKVEIQHHQLAELAERRGLTIVDRYTDDKRSAARANNRPEFDRMMDDLRAGKFEVIIATEEARLARNQEEKLALQVTSAAMGVTWVTLRDGDVDPAEAAGEFLSTIRGAVDRLESRRKGERQRAANKYALEAGKPVPNRRPFGWESDQITPRPSERDLIRLGIDMLLGGSSINAVVRAWNQTGVRTNEGHLWANPNVKQVLKRWRNAGWTERQGEPVAEAVWEAVCTRQELEDVRVILRAKATGIQNGNPAGIASGLAKCACGAGLVQAGRVRVDAPYTYRCKMMTIAGRPAGKHISIRRDILNDAIIKAVLLCYLEAPHDTATDDADVSRLADLHRERERAESAIARLHDVYLDPDAVMSREEYTERGRALKIALGEVQGAVERLTASNVHARMLVDSRKAFLEVARTEGVSLRSAAVGTPEREELERDLRHVWDSLSLEEQRRLVEANLMIKVSPGSRYAKDRVRIVNRLTGRVMNSDRNRFVVVEAIPGRDKGEHDDD